MPTAELHACEIISYEASKSEEKSSERTETKAPEKPRPVSAESFVNLIGV